MIPVHDADALWNNILAIREQAPLVLNVTNYVVTNNTANALLALGASPAMAHAAEEMPELVALAGSLVINIGTPGREQIEGMRASLEKAREIGLPWVLDPVAAGATALRTSLAREFVKEYKPAVVRANASEIMAVAGASGKPKGVDSSQSVDQALESALRLAGDNNVVVQLSGETDLVTNGERAVRLYGGHAMMPRVTGLGCTASAVTGAFLAVEKDPFLAAVHGAGAMNLAGEMAGQNAAGPGSLQLALYDALYTIGPEDVRRGFRVEEVS